MTSKELRTAAERNPNDAPSLRSIEAKVDAILRHLADLAEKAQSKGTK